MSTCKYWWVPPDNCWYIDGLGLGRGKVDGYLQNINEYDSLVHIITKLFFMSDFEEYVPKKDNSSEWIKTRLNINNFSSGKKSTSYSPDYTVVYGERIDDYAYDKPGVRNYNMNMEDKNGNSIFKWTRRDYEYEIPNEEYGKPPVKAYSNYMSLEDVRGARGIWFSTNNLSEYIDSINSYKSHIAEYPEYALYDSVTFEKNIVFTLADMQRVWTSDGNYNKSIIPTAWEVGNKKAFKNALNQLKKDIPSDEQMFNQYTLGENPDKIICRDFAVVTARIAKQLWFEAVAGTIEVGVSHAFTVLRSPETWKYYGISADSVGWPSKVFEWNSLEEIRSNYQSHLLSEWRPQNFGWVFLDDNGKVIGKWQTDLEKRRSEDFLGGDTPTRLLNIKEWTDISFNNWKIGTIDYQSLILQNGSKIEGEYIDSETFFKWWIARMSMGSTDSHVLDIGMWSKLASKPVELSENTKVRAYIAADINASVWHSELKWTQVPFISGNAVIGGELTYSAGKWTFMSDLWKSYEISGPNQMQYPIVKLLPSGEYALFSGEYHGDSMNVLWKAVFENYFTSKRKELSLGIRTENDFVASVYSRDTENNIANFPNEKIHEKWIGFGGPLKKDVDWKLELWKSNSPMWNEKSVQAGISIKF